MARFLTTKGIASFLDEIFKTSKQFVYLVSPYLKFDNLLVERMSDALNNGIKVTLIYGKEKDQMQELDPLIKSRVDIYFYENLHAKFYANEEYLLITSMNIHSYSQAFNREIGVLFSKREKSDLPIIEECLKEYESIRTKAIKLAIEAKNRQALKSISSNNDDVNRIRKKVIDIVKDFADSNYSGTIDQFSQFEKYKIDEFDYEHIIWEIENEFKIPINRKVYYGFHSVNDIISYVISNSQTASVENLLKSRLPEGQFEWIMFLKSTYPNVQFDFIPSGIAAENFPFQGINFSTLYGFMTLDFSNSSMHCRNKIKNELANLQSIFKEYRIYNNYPHQLNIYHAKKTKFNTKLEELEYCHNALKMIEAEFREK
jgi:acyl carrier protein